MRSRYMQYINCLWYTIAILTYALPSATTNCIGFVNTCYMFRPQTLIYTTYKRKIKRILPACWLRIGTGGGNLWMRWWTFEFHKMMGNFLTSWKTVSFSRRTVLHGVSEYILTYLLTCLRMSVLTYIHTYVRTYMHTYIHTYIVRTYVRIYVTYIYIFLIYISLIVWIETCEALTCKNEDDMKVTVLNKTLYTTRYIYIKLNDS
jgi:hypothetical protein